MTIKSADTCPWDGEFQQKLIYAPEKRPGFVAWVTAFPYGDGAIGVSFDETLEKENKKFRSAPIAFAEAVGAPVSYGSIEGGSADQCSYRVYMRSEDGVNFTETGRCARENGSLCNAGFPDGRIVGFDVPRMNEAYTGWDECIRVRESTDGGSTWVEVRRLLEGTAPYLWRVRRLRSGTIVLLASLYGTPWGVGKERTTRNTMLPGETYLSKIQPFFITSEDGRTFSQPHYILPGIGAHEFDFVELPDGRLLFIAGDVQATPVGRQFVQPSPDGWINGNLLPIRTGAPVDPQKNPQGGWLPETICWDESQQCIVGYRRHKTFSISNDFGENWIRVEPDQSFDHLYQPYLLELGDGRLGLYGHIGGDNAFGENDMTIQAQVMRMRCADKLPRAARVSLERKWLPDGSGYCNGFRARLTAGDQPVPGETLEFRFNTYWNEDGSQNTASQPDASRKLQALTDADGWAQVDAPWYDGVADIHLAYTVDVVCHGSELIRGCQGPMMTVLALTPRRKTLFPYDAYFAGGCLYLAPQFMKAFPQAMKALSDAVGSSNVLAEGVLCAEARHRLTACGVLKQGEDGLFRWIHSVHAPRPLNDVKPMLSGDWYI